MNAVTIDAINPNPCKISFSIEEFSEKGDECLVEFSYEGESLLIRVKSWFCLEVLADLHKLVLGKDGLTAKNIASIDGDLSLNFKRIADNDNGAQVLALGFDVLSDKPFSADELGGVVLNVTRAIIIQDDSPLREWSEIFSML